MQTWQGIQWEVGRWAAAQWQELEEVLNSGQEFSMLRIQYPFFVEHPETGQTCEIAIPDPHWYERSVIQRATYREGLFSIYVRWTAGFSDMRKAWVWIDPPKQGGAPANASDFDTLGKGGPDDYPCQASMVETSHGDLLRVGDDTIAFPEYSYRVDPIVEVKCKHGTDGQIPGGVFILPPDYGVKLFVNQIKKE